jgi:hypothetical protein
MDSKIILVALGLERWKLVKFLAIVIVAGLVTTELL